MSEFLRTGGGDGDGKSEIAGNAVHENKFFRNGIDRENLYIGANYGKRQRRKSPAAADVNDIGILRDILRDADTVGEMFDYNFVSVRYRGYVYTAVCLDKFSVKKFEFFGAFQKIFKSVVPENPPKCGGETAH